MRACLGYFFDEMFEFEMPPFLAEYVYDKDYRD